MMFCATLVSVGRVFTHSTKTEDGTAKEEGSRDLLLQPPCKQGATSIAAAAAATAGCIVIVAPNANKTEQASIHTYPK